MTHRSSLLLVHFQLWPLVPAVKHLEPLVSHIKALFSLYLPPWWVVSTKVGVSYSLGHAGQSCQVF